MRVRLVLCDKGNRETVRSALLWSVVQRVVVVLCDKGNRETVRSALLWSAFEWNKFH